MTACEKGSRNLVDLLLDHGAKPDLDGTVSYLQHHCHINFVVLFYLLRLKVPFT